MKVICTCCGKIYCQVKFNRDDIVKVDNNKLYKSALICKIHENIFVQSREKELHGVISEILSIIYEKNDRGTIECTDFIVEPLEIDLHDCDKKIIEYTIKWYFKLNNVTEDFTEQIEIV